ncbi:MAG: inorganic phosphate transporter [Pseudomonadota bacterium]
MEHSLIVAPSAAVILLVIVFALIVVQEAVNGFHDAANAIATVIYSNSLTPVQAVISCALLNFIGVVIGGTAVAFGIVFLLPPGMVAGINTLPEVALMLALVLTALLWNFGTWWLGIPNSTTHTYIGSIMGVAMAHAYLSGETLASGINWPEGEKVVLTLVISPIFGALLAFALFKLLKKLSKRPDMFEPLTPEAKPAAPIRYPLILSSGAVSLLHGTNDGQKSIGLMLMVLMGIAPGLYAIDPARNQGSYEHLISALSDIQSVISESSPDALPSGVSDVERELAELRTLALRDHTADPLTETQEEQVRLDILELREAVTKLQTQLAATGQATTEQTQRLNQARNDLSALIENVPFWLIVLSALSLGIGTMIGYRRIVTTLGERMGERHLSPAQGLSAQIAAVMSIGAADGGGVPVSTTHVLTAGVAGAVKGSAERVRWDTISKIIVTWFTTLPGTMLSAFVLALALHAAIS